MQSGTLEIDLHGMTKVQAKAALDAALRRAGGSVSIMTCAGVS